MAEHGDVVAYCFVPDHLAVTEVEHVYLLEVDSASGGRDGLVEGFVLEAYERAGVPSLHTQPHPDLVVVVGEAEDGKP